MPQAREIKSRIANIKDIKQITKAMNAIAMAKVTRLKNKLEDARPYQEAINENLRLLEKSVESEEDEAEPVSPLLTEGDGEGIGLVVFNSDRGLAGNYTIDINRSARDFVRSREREVSVYAGGEKGHNFFKNWDEFKGSWVDFYQEPDFHKAEAIGTELLNSFESGEFAELWTIYMKFNSDLNQELKVEKVLPLSAEEEEGDKGTAAPVEEHLFEPEREEILANFLEEWFLERVFWVMLNTKTSEHAIRRKAMRDATDNANELIDDLTLTYNKARQQQITREIADIIGGAEALREEA
uniref:ATPase, F1 complex, gamma subunit n=1 Tax=uncultured organism TaxID=155900 RepID=M1P0Q4_9ZZZZ|nr:ATPase, F1 complex, gamma subunit [uncultured organism]AGF93322.1 ATPase, F1 complex, gamma subunit [uncultured organism]